MIVSLSLFRHGLKISILIYENGTVLLDIQLADALHEEFLVH